MATKKPTAKREKSKSSASVIKLPYRVWFEMELDSEEDPGEKGVSVRFDYATDEPTICLDFGGQFSVSNILEIAEVVEVLPKLKLVSMC